MKVAYITMRFPVPSETFAGTDVRVLRNEGESVSVYTMRAPTGAPGRLLGERRLSGLAISQGTFAADLRGLASCFGRPAFLAHLLSWLVRVAWNRPVHLVKSLVLLPRSMGILFELEREPPDVVHLFWGHYPSIVGWLVLAALPDTILSVFVGAYDLTTLYGGSAWVAQRAHLVSTHARFNFPAIEALGVPRERIHLAYRGIDPGAFSGGAARKVRHRIVSAGRLEADKAMRDVLLTFREVLAKWPDATLRILGDGRERLRLQRLSRSLGIDGAVRFLGHVSHQDVATELSEAEIFLHMSLAERPRNAVTEALCFWGKDVPAQETAERLPNAVKEAMASRCLCVVTATKGMDELVVDGRHGFVVSPHGVETAAARIDDVFGGRVDVAPLLDAASAHVARYFDGVESMRSYRRRWADLLATRQRRASA